MSESDWTHATRWPDDEPDELLCLWPARSDWPVFHYDGRWRCSMPLGHEEHGVPHIALTSHDPKQGLVWVGPWVPAETLAQHVAG